MQSCMYPTCFPHVENLQLTKQPRMYPLSRMYPRTVSEQIMYPCILDTFEMHISRRVLMSQILIGEIHVQLTTGMVTF